MGDKGVRDLSGPVLSSEENGRGVLSLKKEACHSSISVFSSVQAGSTTLNIVAFDAATFL